MNFDFEKNIKTSWDEEAGIARAQLCVKGRQYHGQAFCCPDDLDMKNKLTGERIAAFRAIIACLKDQKREIKIIMEAYKDMYNHVPKYCKDEAKDWYDGAADIYDMYNSLLNSYKEGLKEYLALKEDMYCKIRANRTKVVK